MKINPAWPLSLACALHAGAITWLWYMMIWRDQSVVPTRVWLALVYAWLPWVIFILLPGRRDRLWWGGTLVLALAILSPTFSTLYAWAVWSVAGFAP